MPIENIQFYQKKKELSSDSLSSYQRILENDKPSLTRCWCRCWVLVSAERFMSNRSWVKKRNNNNIPLTLTATSNMLKKNQGYGICGSKNIYSARVRVDNWVEDTIGMKLSENPRPGVANYETNTTRCFRPPSECEAPPPMPVNIPSAHELKTKNKEGMPYSLIFDHSMKPSESEVDYLIIFSIQYHS